MSSEWVARGGAPRRGTRQRPLGRWWPSDSASTLVDALYDNCPARLARDLPGPPADREACGGSACLDG
jgi:hypothetical protein